VKLRVEAVKSRVDCMSLAKRFVEEDPIFNYLRAAQNYDCDVIRSLCCTFSFIVFIFNFLIFCNIVPHHFQGTVTLFYWDIQEFILVYQ
jgi:hypothetical protein